MAIARNHTWEADLHHYLAGQLDQQFQFGVRDCCLFVCNAILAMTGTDVAAGFRGSYSTAIGAARTIKSITGTGPTVEDAANYVTEKFGMPKLAAVLLAQRGDVVLYDSNEGPILGLVGLNGRDVLFVTEMAMRRIPLAQCRAAWRV
jgi:hypothetical protein